MHDEAQSQQIELTSSAPDASQWVARSSMWACILSNLYQNAIESEFSFEILPPSARYVHLVKLFPLFLYCVFLLKATQPSKHSVPTWHQMLWINFFYEIGGVAPTGYINKEIFKNTKDKKK
jgi:hypothetical protein